MTHEEKIDYMRLAMGLAQFGFTNEQLDLLVSMYELVVEKQGDTDLNSMTTVVYDCREREKVRKKDKIREEIKK